MTLRDQTNGYAVAACYFSFDDGGVNVPADDTLVASALKRDDYRVLEFLFPDTATTNEVGIYRWTFQVRVPPPASVMRVDCKPWNRVSKALFGPLKVTKVSGPWISRPAGRNIRRNFRLVDGTDSLTVEGVAKSLHAGRVRIDVDSWQADGEESHTQTCVVDSNGVFRTDISFPPRTYGGCWSLGDVDAESVGETTFEPLWAYPSYRDKELQNVDKDSLDEQVDVEGCDAVDVVVQTYSDDSTMADNNCAVIVRAQLLDEHGEEMPLTSLPFSSKWGRYWYCSAGYGAHLTRRKVDIPSGARTLKLSISKFWEQANVILTDYRAIKTFAETPKLTYDADAQLKMSVVDWLGGENAVDQILTGSVPSLFVSLCESIEGCGCASAPDEKTIVFTSFTTPYQLKASIDWSENPFGNLTWQMNYSTGYWIPFTGLKADDYYAHVKRYWTSFFACNPWPRKANNMVYMDHASAARVEALLLTMFGNEPNERCAAKIPCLLDKLRGDPEFFYQILNQLRIDVELIHHHLKSKIYRIHNHNLIMAQVLLEFSQCFPKCGFSRRYAELSRYKIQEHLNLMFEPDGFIREQSTKYHHCILQRFIGIIENAGLRIQELSMLLD